MTLCYEYNNATLLEEVYVHYVAINCWWYFSGVAYVFGFHKLENWLNFGTFVLENGEAS